jgi:hypothetical protein
MKFRFKSQSRKGNLNVCFPHQVAFKKAEPLLVGLMDSYCSARSVPHGIRRDMRGHLRYCFMISCHADTFAEVFGGDRIDVATRDEPDARLVRSDHPPEE